MIRRHLMLAALALSASGCSSAPVINNEYLPFVASHLRQATENWFTGLRTGDATLLGALLADDVTIQAHDGATATKASLLEGLRTGQFRVDSVTAATSRTRIQGTTAIVTGTADVHRQLGGQPVLERLAYTAVYGYTGKAWLMLAWQATKRPE